MSLTEEQILQAQIDATLEALRSPEGMPEEGVVIEALSDSFGLNATSFADTEIPQTSLSNIGLGETVIALQQELSEQFGIPTFDIEGNISTIPLTVAINEAIDVGTGRFTESTFRTSLELLQQSTSITTATNASWIDVAVDTFNKFISDIFTDKDLESMTPEERMKLQAIDDEIARLQSEIIPVPGCQSIWTGSFVRSGRTINSYNTDCSAMDAATQHNFIRNRMISKLKAERDTFIKQTVIVREISAIVVGLSNELDELINNNPATASIKAEITTKLKEASALIERILAEGVEITREELSRLQLLMQAGAFKLREETTQESTVVQDITKFFGGVLGATEDFLLQGLNQIADSIIKGLIAAMIPTPETIAQFARDTIEAVKILKTESIGVVDVEAFNVERIQKEVAGG